MMHVLSRGESLKQLTGTYGMSQEQAVRALAIADHHGVTAQDTPSNKAVTIRARHNGKEQYEVDDGLPPEAVGRKAGVRYTSGTGRGDKTPPTKESRAMAKGRAAAAVEPDQNGTPDLSGYAEKEPTIKMVDYHEWLEEQLGQKLDLHSMYVGVTLYPHFQRSDFNKERTAARREQREAEASSEPEPETTPRPTGRKAATGGTTGKRAGTQATGRGRGRKAASGSAPF